MFVIILINSLAVIPQTTATPVPHRVHIEYYERTVCLPSRLVFRTRFSFDSFS